ncbi:MAG: ABC transporter permease [candidate division KSB1 bacterium]|nr:ABC transporter permease [candidate division KSB1 bacterium]
MRNFVAILEREVRSYFLSPLAYVVIFFFLAVSGIFFYLILSNFVEICIRATMQAQMYQMMPPKLNVNMMAIRPMLHNMALFALFFLPLVTMKLYAEEKKTGTIELLMTSPITDAQVMLGKYTASLVLYLTMLALTFVYMAFLYAYGEPETGPILSGYLGLFLLGAAYLAFGLLFSSLTENQIIAAASTFAFILVFWAIGWVSDFVSPSVGRVLSYFSLIEHFEDFARGVIDTKHIVFYLSFVFFGLFLTYLSIQSARWRGAK